MQKKYNYSSRWDMVKRGFTEGNDEAKKAGLRGDWRNWSPLHNHIYQTGVLAGVFGAISACGIYWLLLKLLLYFMRQ